MAKRKPKPKPTGPFRDRVKDLRRVKASELVGAPWNWRAHPDAQRDAVAGSLEELGITDALKCRERPDGRLELWDGHLRQEIIDNVGPDTLVPVLVTDLSEAEAKKANLIHDPLAGMAEADGEKLAGLLSDTTLEHERLAVLLLELEASAQATALKPAGESPIARELASGKESRQREVRAILWMGDVATFERALAATGKVNRAEALLDVCNDYLKAKGGHVDASAESIPSPASPPRARRRARKRG